jgi:hypothetical protein
MFGTFGEQTVPFGQMALGRLFIQEFLGNLTINLRSLFGLTIILQLILENVVFCLLLSEMSYYVLD